MRKRTRLILILVAAALGAVVTWFIVRSPETSKLAAYKSELRAKGEKLTWAELGYPRPVEPGRAMERLLAGVHRLPATGLEPRQFELMKFTAAGAALTAWQAPSPPRTILSTNQLTWAELAIEFEAASGAFEQIRSALTNPPARFYSNPEDMLDGPKPPFVQLRNAAQWLTADLVLALQTNQKARARSDVVALAQLAQVHREDHTLVSQMIRIAITGLGHVATWEALQADGWTETDLAAMQVAWEKVDLLVALEQGLEGERAFGEMGFIMARNRDPDFQDTMGYLLDSITNPYWRMHIDSDELFMLRHYQRSLEAIRRLRGNGVWSDARRDFDATAAELTAALGHPIKRYRYVLSGLMIPNTTRATTTVVRNETQRRLTLVALALERHRARHGNYPADLQTMVPEFLTAAPLDLMSARPFGYRLNADDTFTLYSVGEDGLDDGGNPQPTSVTNRFDLWSGRDAVWPKASD